MSQRQLEDVDTPSHQDALRYFTAGTNAQVAREHVFYEALEWERRHGTGA
jgi:hypothetical protein